jgi:nucleoside-diphosphate-sugar epimerase
MRTLIVGCGYVGTALGRELVQQGHQVWGLRRTPANEELTAAGIFPLTADITQPESLEPLPKNWDWVVNCISASGGGAEDYRRIYLEGSRNLLAWLAASPPQKLVYTSSTGVYGQDDGSVVDESSPTLPTTQTGVVLVETERLWLQAAEQSGFPAVILRVAGIYGPGRGYWLKQFLAGTAVVDTGPRKLNMIHRDDVAGAIYAALMRGQPGHVYNVSDSESPTQFELFRWLAARLNRPMPTTLPQAADQRRRTATNKIVSNQRLRAKLGYRLKYPTFREGFEAELTRESFLK